MRSRDARIFSHLNTRVTSFLPVVPSSFDNLDSAQELALLSKILPDCHLLPFSDFWCSRSLMGLRQHGKWPVISDPPLLVEASTVNSHSESPPPSPLPTPGSSCPPLSSFPLKQLKARGNFFTTTKFTSNTHTVTGV